MSEMPTRRMLRKEDQSPEVLRGLVAELVAALGQINPNNLDAASRDRFDRAWTAARALTRLVGASERMGGDLPDTAPDLIGYRVLLTAADMAAATEYETILARLGARCELAPTSAVALNLLGEGGIDLALVDAEVGGGSGAQVITALRRHAPPQGRIPVLGLYREGQADARDALRKAGADFTLATPLVDPKAMTAALAGLIDGAGDEAELPDQLLLDFERYERLIDIAGEDGARELLDRLEEDLRQVERGLERALRESNRAEIRTQTHVLIALAGAVGADALQKLAESLNAAAHRKGSEGMIGLGRQTLRQLGHLVEFVGEEIQIRA